jgi:hypothetical protein
MPTKSSNSIILGKITTMTDRQKDFFSKLLTHLCKAYPYYKSSLLAQFDVFKIFSLFNRQLSRHINVKTLGTALLVLSSQVGAYLSFVGFKQIWQFKQVKTAVNINLH